MIRKDSKMKNKNEILAEKHSEIESLKGWSKNLESKIVKLKGERDSLVQLANDRFDVIENLQEIVDQYTNEPKNKSLVDEVIKLKTENQKLKNDNDITQSNLGECLKDNEKLESEIKKLKTHFRLISKLCNYELFEMLQTKLGYKK